MIDVKRHSIFLVWKKKWNKNHSEESHLDTDCNDNLQNGVCRLIIDKSRDFLGKSVENSVLAEKLASQKQKWWINDYG